MNSKSSQNRSHVGVKLWKFYGVHPFYVTIDEPSRAYKLKAQAIRNKNDGDNDDIDRNHILIPIQSPLQGSITGSKIVTGFNGDVLQYGFPDLSHFGIGIGQLQTCFVPLPSVYTDLYQQAIFFSDASLRSQDDDPAICLVCGRLFNAGNKSSDSTFSIDIKPGECTLHARSCGAGIGVYFLIQTCKVLLVKGSRSCYYPSIYLDSIGEVNEYRGQKRPMFLSMTRYRKLEELYLSHQIGITVIRNRSSADSIIRTNWY